MDTEKNLAIERGRRFKSLRLLTGLSTIDLAKLAGLSRVSISYWENAARNKGLTRAGAEKVITALSKIGIECDIGWLWFGVGNTPQVVPKNAYSSDQQDTFLSDMPNSQAFVFSLNKEIEVFLSMNKGAVIAKIEDDLMLPMYEKGDIVGGLWKPVEAITSPKNTILKMNNLIVVRNATKNKNKLRISHLNAKATDPISFRDFDPELIAPIIRVWKY